MTFAEIQIHFKPCDFSAGSDLHVLEHRAQKFQMRNLFGRIDVLVDLFGIHAFTNHLGGDLVSERRRARVAEAVGVGHDRDIKTERDVFIDLREIEFSEKMKEQFSDARAGRCPKRASRAADK